MDAFKKAMDQAQQAASQAASQAKVAGSQVQQKMGDPATQAQARVQMAKAGVEARRVAGKARRGVTTIIERIDPGLLADVVIKATALQERANAALRAKKSPYRIAEVVISAAIPPQVSFSIARKDDYEEAIASEQVIESARIVDVASGEDGAVLALDGSGPPVDEIDVDEVDVDVRDVDPRG
jgi:hypothetical protein